MNILAIIPARSGSKGLKNKNIKELNGKPLISYTIVEAINSKLFEKVMVSTDSKEYAEIAIKYGAEVPFLRSKRTSKDKSSTWDVVKEVLENYKSINYEFDIITILQPTSPLRTSQNIRDAFDLFIKKNASSVIAISETEHSPLWSNKLPKNLSMNNFLTNDVKNKNRQALEKYYRINGSIYMISSKIFSENKIDIYENSYGLIMKKINSIDIDDELDFSVAEIYMKKIAGDK